MVLAGLRAQKPALVTLWWRLAAIPGHPGDVSASIFTDPTDGVATRSGWMDTAASGITKDCTAKVPQVTSLRSHRSTGHLPAGWPPVTAYARSRICTRPQPQIVLL